MNTISLALTIGVGFAAFISPIAVALINNHHQKNIKLAELNHEETLKTLELKHNETIRSIEMQHQLNECRLNVTYQSKKDAFSELVEAASKYYCDINNQELLSSLYSSAYKASMYCTRNDCKNSISGFATTAYEHFYAKTNDDLQKAFIHQMDYLSFVLYTELNSQLSTQEQLQA